MSSQSAGFQFCHDSLATQCGKVIRENAASSKSGFVAASANFPPKSQPPSNGIVRLAGPGWLEVVWPATPRLPKTGTAARADAPRAALRINSRREKSRLRFCCVIIFFIFQQAWKCKEWKSGAQGLSVACIEIISAPRIWQEVPEDSEHSCHGLMAADSLFKQ